MNFAAGESAGCAESDGKSPLQETPSPWQGSSRGGSCRRPSQRVIKRHAMAPELVSDRWPAPTGLTQLQRYAAEARRLARLFRAQQEWAELMDHEGGNEASVANSPSATMQRSRART